MKKVVILGANGHLGYNLSKLLIEKGYFVRATVRDINNPDKTQHLSDLGVELFEADLMRQTQLEKAMTGMDGVFQLAAVFNVTSKNPEKEVMKPTIEGALNVVRACAKCKIKKLIFTSSIAAVGTVQHGQPSLNEKSWNENAIEPYAKAKTISERKAWALSRELGVDMVSILPSTMIGPGFFRHTPSTLSFELLMKGKIPFALPMTFDFVDVRDVAKAHVLAFESNSAKGRYIASGTPLSFKDLFAKITQIAPEVKVPSKELPTRFLGVVPFLDWLSNKLEGTPRFSSKELIQEYGNREQQVDAGRIKDELGWTPSPIDTAISDTLTWVKAKYI